MVGFTLQVESRNIKNIPRPTGQDSDRTLPSQLIIKHVIPCYHEPDVPK